MKTITQTELDAQIESGKPLVLIGYDLSNRDLRGSNLSGSNLRHSDLRNCDLSYCDLSYCDLSYCNLRNSDLRGSKLRGAKGFHLLPVQDPRGYSFVHTVECKDGWRIRSGCRNFTIAEAAKHWGPNYTGDRSIGDDYLYAIEWLERKIK